MDSRIPDIPWSSGPFPRTRQFLLECKDQADAPWHCADNWGRDDGDDRPPPPTPTAADLHAWGAQLALKARFVRVVDRRRPRILYAWHRGLMLIAVSSDLI
jgi:hypothetical protein